MTSLFAELKRRNVFRVGAAYAVVGWLLTQVVGTVAPILALPEWFPRAVLVVIAVGFPITLLMAWAFELTPEGVKKTEAVEAGASVTALTGRKLDFVIIAALILALGYFIWERQTVRPPSGEAPGTAASADAGPARSIAVLPFIDLSAAGDQGYFGDGIAEELLNNLAKIRSLKVAGRTSSFAFKGHNEDLRTIGDTLGVETVLEGSIRRDGDMVRITAQLINAKDGFHLWSETYDREMTSIFSVQDEISHAIVDALKVTLGAAEESRLAEGPPTENMAAYERYLQGRDKFFARQDVNVREGIRLFSEAVLLDPEFAEAYAMLALAYTQQDEPELGRAAADRALALDTRLANAWTAKSSLIFHSSYQRNMLGDGSIGHKFSEGEELLLKALTLEPRNATANLWYGIHLYGAGRVRAALPYFERAAEIEPLSGINWGWQGIAWIALKDEEKGLAFSRKAKELGWLNAMALWTGPHYLGKGDLIRFRESIRSAYSEEDAPVEVTDEAVRARAMELIEILPDPSMRPRVLEILADMRKEDADPDILLASAAYMEIGDYETALRESSLATLASFLNNQFGETNNLPILKDAMKSSGMVDYWRQYGWPANCHPAKDENGEDDFECE